eukprot:1144253-Pelagomonas_calceolata.AAC.5
MSHSGRGMQRSQWLRAVLAQADLLCECQLSLSEFVPGPGSPENAHASRILGRTVFRHRTHI